MSDLKNILRDVGYFSVGAAAMLVEAGGKAVKCLVRKGEATLRDNQDTVDELKRKAKDLGEKAKAAMEKAAKPEKSPVDASQLTPEARAELRRQLDEADAACGADAACESCDSCEEAEPARPVAPDVIYHTDASVSQTASVPQTASVLEESGGEDAPENTPNG